MVSIDTWPFCTNMWQKYIRLKLEKTANLVSNLWFLLCLSPYSFILHIWVINLRFFFFFNLSAFHHLKLFTFWHGLYQLTCSKKFPSKSLRKKNYIKIKLVRIENKIEILNKLVLWQVTKKCYHFLQAKSHDIPKLFCVKI